MITKRIIKTVKPNVGIRGNVAFQDDDILFDWTAFQIPRGSAKLVSATAILKPKGDAGPTANVFPLELWFANEDMRTHVLIFGSTGSGKTEALVSMAYNALLQACGFIYVDGKGDNSLYAKVFSMCRSMGREDDLLLINFLCISNR